MASAYEISLVDLAVIFIPLVITIVIYIRWVTDWHTPVLASLRMLAQLLLIGFFLKFIFEAGSALTAVLVLSVMIGVAAWIALRPLAGIRRRLYIKTLAALVLGGGPVLALVVLGVVRLSPWYLPRYLIPLAGMIFANGMNSISLCAERMCSELDHGRNLEQARSFAYRAGLLPLTNSFFAVGLVSIPGMMTGQILSGISPLLAARYQIMVMCMLMGACGISSAVFLYLVRPEIQERFDRQDTASVCAE